MRMEVTKMKDGPSTGSISKDPLPNIMHRELPSLLIFFRQSTRESIHVWICLKKSTTRWKWDIAEKICCMHAVCFAHYLGTLRYLQSYRNASYNDSISSDPIMITVHYMKENIGKKVTLQELADNLGYSASHFSAIFTQKMGNSPLNYFNH